MIRLYYSGAVGAVLAILLLMSVFFSSLSYTRPPNVIMPLRFTILSVEYNGDKIIVAEHLQDLTNALVNHTVAGRARLIVNTTGIVASGDISIKYTGRIPQEYSKTIVDIYYGTRYLNKTAILYHVVLKKETVLSSTIYSDVAESYIIYNHSGASEITYNITGTNTTTVYLLDAMIRKILLYPLMVAHVLESRKDVGGNTTVIGRADASNVTLVIKGEIHIVMGLLATKTSKLFTVLSMRLIYNTSASYSEPLCEIIRRILTTGIGNYLGETGVNEVFQTYIQGITVASSRTAIHVLNNIMASSLVMNWTSLKLGFEAYNDSIVLETSILADTSGKSLPEIFLVLNLAARGYRASSIKELLSKLNTIFNGTQTDPITALNTVNKILGIPVYSLEPEVYMGASKSILKTQAEINKSSIEIISRLVEILDIKTNITITDHEVIIQPFPGPREDLAVYMSLKNIKPIIGATAKTTMATTTTTTPVQTTTQQPRTTTAKTTIIPTTPPPTETKTVPPAHIQKQASTQKTQTTTTTSSGAGTNTSPLIILIPVIAFALIILILHYRAKNRVTQELVEELGETLSPENEQYLPRILGEYYLIRINMST